MNHSLTIFAALIVVISVLSGCESNNEKVKRVVRETVDTVTPMAILEAANELDKRHDDSEGMLIPLDALPASLAAFNPVEVRYMFRGSYLIVTDRWVQHRSGLRIAAPDEDISSSTKYVTYEKLANRLYLYQD